MYVQRISDPRFSGQQAKNLRMFQELCGTNTFKNVVVLTTYWDQVNAALGEKRENQLQSKFFKTVVDGGGRFIRHDGTAKTARAVLGFVFDELAPVITQIQTEMGLEGKSLINTAAGSVQHKEIQRIISKHKDEVASLMAEMDAMKESNIAARRQLEEEMAQLQEQLGRRETENAELKQGLQVQVAQWETERTALEESRDKETRARQKLEADLVAERANHVQLRREQERLQEEQADSNAKLAEVNRQWEEKLRESEKRLREQEQRAKEQEESSVGRRIEKEVSRNLRKIGLR